jgi:hypothetical protein
MEALFYAIGLMPYAVAAGLGLAIPLLMLGSYNHYGIGLVVMGAAWVFDNLNQSQPFARIGITLYPPDLPMILIGAAAGLRWLLRDDIPRRFWPWVCWAALFFIDFAIGLAQNGTTAGVQARPHYYALAAASYAMSFPMTAHRVRQILHLFIALALATLLICCYRWTVYYLPIPELLPPAGFYNVDGAIRVVGAPFALMIAEVLVLGLFFSAKNIAGTAARILTPFMLAGMLLLQHRSVWLAAIVAFLMSLVLARAQRAPLWQQLLVTVLVATAAATPIFSSSVVSQQIESSAERALAGQDTVNARFRNWRANLQQWRDDGPRAIAIGRVLGSDTSVFVEGERGGTQRVTYGAHNQYVTQITYFGVLGLLAMTLTFAYVARGLWRLTGKGGETAALSAVMLVLIGAQLTFYIAYWVDFVQYIVLGSALSWVAGYEKVNSKDAERAARVGPLGSFKRA